MSDIGNSSIVFVQGILLLFSWGIGLAVAARFVFGTTRRKAFAWFMVGFFINLVTFLVIMREVSSFLPEWSNTWSDNDYRLRRLHTGIVAIPVLAVTIGVAYGAYRRMMLNRTDAANGIESRSEGSNHPAEDQGPS